MAGVVKPNDDSGQTENSSFNNTRRQVVAGTAGVLGGLAAGGGLVGSTLAQEDEGEDEEEETDEETDEEEEEMPESEFEDDVEILNYALTLEYLEADFYRQGLENISEEELCTCEALNQDSPLADRAYSELETVQAHEETHAETLVSAIEDLGGTPIEEPEFDFGIRVDYPVAFLSTAAQLEDVGVSAYAGAAPYIESEELVPPALGIHSVEARHASFLRTLVDRTSFPNAFDEARSKSEVLDLVRGFIVSDMDMGGDEEEGEGEDEADSDDPMDGDSEDESDAPEEDGDDDTDAPEEDDTVDNGTDDSGSDVPDGNETDDSGSDVPDGNETDDNETDT